MKSKIAITVLVILVALTGVLVYWVFSHGFSARAEPSRIEKAMVQRMHRIAIPSGTSKLKNPEPVNEAILSEAREHFVEHCAVCHGIDGSGNTTFGRNMYPKVPDLRAADTEQLSDGELFYIISNGVRFTGMPAFGGEDSPQEIWHLVSFLRRVPQLSPEELKQMQELAGEKGGQEREGAKQNSGGDKRKPAKPHSHGTDAKPHQH